MNEQKLKEKLVEYVGFKLKPTVRSWGTIDWPDYSWHTPQGEPLWDESALPDFPHSLDDCLKWLVPKLLTCLDSRTAKIELKYGRTKEMNWTFLFEDWQPHSYHYAQAETPALALCLAIEKLIDLEEK